MFQLLYAFPTAYLGTSDRFSRSWNSSRTEKEAILRSSNTEQHKPAATRRSKKNAKQSTAGIRWWSPTQLLTCRHNGSIWLSGREALLSLFYGRLREVLQSEEYIYELYWCGVGTVRLCIGVMERAVSMNRTQRYCRRKGGENIRKAYAPRIIIGFSSHSYSHQTHAAKSCSSVQLYNHPSSNSSYAHSHPSRPLGSTASTWAHP